MMKICAALELMPLPILLPLPTYRHLFPNHRLVISTVEFRL
jgi:hypothetical protein